MAGPNNAPGMHGGLLSGFGAFAPSIDVQTFVPVALSQLQPAATAGQTLYDSWCKPKGCNVVRVLMVGPGGGGGSGRKGSTTTICCGGGGGSGGGFIDQTFLGSDLPDEVPLVVVPGQAGGAAVVANDTNGNPSSSTPNAGFTVFGSWRNSGSFVAGALPPILSAQGGNPGVGGTASSGSGGSGSAYGYTYSGTAGAASNSSGNAGSNAPGNGTGAPGGGSGAGLTSGNAHSAGGNGGAFLSGQYTNNSDVSPPAGGGSAGGGAGFVGVNGLLASLGLGYTVLANVNTPTFIAVGGGGGGGGSASAADAVSGGNGGNGMWGGGGGGGGAATDTTSPQSGAGGNGGDSFIIVMSW